jgi:hypothetical protein
MERAHGHNAHSADVPHCALLCVASQEDTFAMQTMVLKPERWEGKATVAAYAAHAYGASVFDSNGAGLNCFFHAAAAASWAWLARGEHEKIAQQRYTNPSVCPSHSQKPHVWKKEWEASV